MTEHNQDQFVQPEDRAGTRPEGSSAGSTPPDGWSTSNPPYSSPTAAPYYWAPHNASYNASDSASDSAPANGANGGPAHDAAWTAGAPGAPWVAAPYLPQPVAQGSRPEHHRGLRTSLALLLVAAGVGVGVVAGRETQHNSSLGLSTTQVDSGAGAAGSSVGTGASSGSATGSGTGTSSGTGTGTGTGTGSGTGTGTGSGDGSNTTPGGGWGWGAGGPGGLPGGIPSGQTGGTETPRVKATAAQQVGVVNINTVLKYQSASAAGTGMVLSSDGEILTNNHVVNGATSITVTVVSTGKTYAAAVVGTDARDDIAVIKLKNASGLSTAKLATTAAVKTGDKVTGVGNAGGVGGTPSAATGKVTALNQSITASDEGGTNAEKLTGLIQNDADIVAGDSGGPLYNAAGSIIGINTAGASTNQYSAQDVSYAIPISTAVSIAGQIEQGKASAKVHIGSTAFLGISVATASTGSAGATISDVVAAGPAARAGIVAGDVITSIGGHRVTSATSLSSVMDGYHGGDKLKVEWKTAAGKTKHATITTIAGPAK